VNLSLYSEDKFVKYDDELFVYHDLNGEPDERITRYIPTIESMIASWNMS
jgi:hypothetical protein